MAIRKENFEVICAVKAYIEKEVDGVAFDIQASEEISNKLSNIHAGGLKEYAERIGFPQFNELLREIVITRYEQYDLLPFIHELNPKVSYDATYQLYIRFDTGKSSGIKRIGAVIYRGKNTSIIPSQMALGANTLIELDPSIGFKVSEGKDE